MTLARLVILNPSAVTLSPSYVILNEVKNLRTSSVKDLWQADPLPKRFSDNTGAPSVMRGAQSGLRQAQPERGSFSSDFQVTILAVFLPYRLGAEWV